ncbi:MAG: leucine-rich repeat domain-containing protein [Clostridia bacterium]|nr:leucine-rich repeat domain-containing protein [Clostridia bacterium]
MWEFDEEQGMLIDDETDCIICDVKLTHPNNDAYYEAVLPEGIEQIGEYAFYYCTCLTAIKIPDSVKIIAPSAFEGCSALTSVTIPNGVTSIGSSAFEGCSALTNITIPDSVTNISDSAFSNCSALANITVSSGNTKYHSENNCLIETKSKTLILGCKSSIIPSDGSVTSIGDGAFNTCNELTNIVIPDCVTSIGEFAFYNCHKLTSVSIGNNVTEISTYAPFSSCSSLTHITVSSGNTKYHSVNNCLIETKSKALILGCKSSIIPSDGSVTSISARAFEGCSEMTSIVIPDSITSIGWDAFNYCNSLTSITVSDGNPRYYSENNCLIAADMEVLVRGCNTSIIPTDGSVSSINFRAFSGCHELTNINIPDSITHIGLDAFGSCNKLTNISFNGTKAQWIAIKKSSLGENTDDYIIHCTDGDLDKNDEEV